MLPRRAPFVLVLIAILSIVRFVRAEDAQAVAANDAAARSAFEAGRDAYEHGYFASALAHFEEAYALHPSPELLYNVGRAADSDGQAKRAISSYSAYLERYPSAANRDFVQARLTKMRELDRAVTSEEPRSLPRVSNVQPPERTTLPPEAPRHDAPRSVWKSPWLWSAVAVVVAGGVIAGGVMARDRTPERARADAYVYVPEGR